MIASTLARTASSRAHPLADNPSKKSRCLRAQAATMASAYTYLASDGSGQARLALLALPLWSAEMQDGRGSTAFLRLWDQLRRMKRAGKIRGVIASDVGRSTAPGQERDASMAKAWTVITAPDDGIILALVGNVHAMRKPMTFSDQTIVTAGSLMPANRTITVNVVGDGGKAWNCQKDGCNAHDNGPFRQVKDGITYSTDADREWDATTNWAYLRRQQHLQWQRK